eukprot:gene8895-biopygen3172
MVRRRPALVTPTMGWGGTGAEGAGEKMGAEPQKERTSTKWLWEAAPEAPPGNKKKAGLFRSAPQAPQKNNTELETNVTTRLLFTQELRGTHHTTEYPQPCDDNDGVGSANHAGAGTVCRTRRVNSRMQRFAQSVG